MKTIRFSGVGDNLVHVSVRAERSVLCSDEGYYADLDGYVEFRIFAEGYTDAFEFLVHCHYGNRGCWYFAPGLSDADGWMPYVPQFDVDDNECSMVMTVEVPDGVSLERVA